MEIFFYASQWIFLGYFVGLNVGYIALNLVALGTIKRHMEENVLNLLPDGATDIMPPVSVIIPAFNEFKTIVTSVTAALQLDYPEHEVLVINDGSTDTTLEVMIETFDLKLFPEAYCVKIYTQPIKNIYYSPKYKNLRVIDKGNGGKADAINAGINSARYPLFCAIDADSILEQNGLKRAAQPFVLDNTTVATGGTIRIINGCETRNGFILKPHLPKNILALFQVVDYLRAFLFGRLGWSPFNALLIISGAFGVFHKDTVISVGGYRTDTVGEDMELVIRLHRLLSQQKRPYRITYIPDPICWTEAPEDLKSLMDQRMRWQRGLAESLFMNFSMCLNPKSGVVGLISFPFFLIFEFLGPVIEVFGFCIVTVGLIFDYISFEIYFILLTTAIALGVLLSITALFLEEASFHIYQKPRDLLILSIIVIIENLGFRQLNSIWRIQGTFQWLYRVERKWGEVLRTGKWH